MDETVSIGTVKRDISELVNRVAYGGERIVLTSRGKPKAALVSFEDYQTLQHAETHQRKAHMAAWLARAAEISQEILARRGGEMIDVDAFLESNRKDMEDRDGRHLRGD